MQYSEIDNKNKYEKVCDKVSIRIIMPKFLSCLFDGFQQITNNLLWQFFIFANIVDDIGLVKSEK